MEDLGACVRILRLANTLHARIVVKLPWWLWNILGLQVNGGQHLKKVLTAQVRCGIVVLGGNNFMATKTTIYMTPTNSAEVPDPFILSQVEFSVSREDGWTRFTSKNDRSIVAAFPPNAVRAVRVEELDPAVSQGNGGLSLVRD